MKNKTKNWDFIILNHNCIGEKSCCAINKHMAKLKKPILVVVDSNSSDLAIVVCERGTTPGQAQKFFDEVSAPPDVFKSPVAAFLS